MNNAFLIAATSSGSGKTTLSLGLMRHLRKKGFNVMPFKCGPDYIDPIYHKIATGKDSINLDLFMASENHVRNLFAAYGEKNDISIVEGVMGMYDGYREMDGSTADLAEKLGIPVVLLVNAASTAYSVAATIYGFANFKPDIRIAGVIFNRVASKSHYEYLKKACQDLNIPALGYLKKNERLQVPSRHLGLSIESKDLIEKFVEEAEKEVEKNIDVDKLLELTAFQGDNVEKAQKIKKGLRVAVAYDEAFNFIYPANLDGFSSDIILFSPLKDRSLPEADLIYLPGGYPEFFAELLEKNEEMKSAIKNYAEKDGKILAECGGMIYLGEEIDGRKMCGVLPLSVTMENARLKLGYRKVVFPGLTLRGHEFHYSTTKEIKPMPKCAHQFNVRGEKTDTPVYRYKNVIASYTHLYWGEEDIFKLWD